MAEEKRLVEEAAEKARLEDAVRVAKEALENARQENEDKMKKQAEKARI